MLMRTDPFRELDRFAQQVLGTYGTTARPAVMPMDAWRDGDMFHVEFDLPGVTPDSIELDVERNVVTVKAERPVRASDADLIAAERAHGVFSRQLVLGEDRVHRADDLALFVVDTDVGIDVKLRRARLSVNAGDRTDIDAGAVVGA